ncbi:MAG: malto-oligosyltrehalose synthase [Hyphomicrobiaceae bacterium]
MSKVPSATYRLQLRGGMTFDAAAALAPYFARLGISHIYLSPIFEATPGSTHGYDVTDCNRIDPILGGEAGFEALYDALRRNGLRAIVDFVPNHMAASPDNRWWRDVLEWGRNSRYANHFDIDWTAPKLLLPVLGDAYGRTLVAGELKIAFDRYTGEFNIDYGDLRLPLSPPTYPGILERVGNDICAALASQFATSNPTSVDTLKRAVSKLAVDNNFANLMIRTCSDIQDNTEQMHALLEEQVWRIAHWRLGREQLTYRRFFEITGLVGLRVERPKVFDDVHRKLLALVRSGLIDGIRLDHIDGLADPSEYLQRLRDELRSHTASYIVVEKILGPKELLRPEWSIEGTTGYEFINLLTGLLLESDGEQTLTRAYRDFLGHDIDYEFRAAEVKREILGSNLAAELVRLVDAARILAAKDVATRDIGTDALRRALIELATAFPVYRTYIDKSGAHGADRTIITQVLAQAKASRRVDNEDALNFLARVLLLELPDEGLRRDALAFTTAFQQTTGPIMAKAIEDTLFYRSNRLIALNEVGGEPTHFGVQIDDFHSAMNERRSRQPHGLSATATHDTKRGEDARARICVLSEISQAWSQGVRRWRHLNLHLTTALHADRSPDGEMEWLFYQALLGAWPMDLVPHDTSGLSILADRMSDFMRKAAREAKVHTSWAIEDAVYEAALDRFVRGALDPDRSGAFLGDFLSTISPIIVTGALNSLSQTLIKLTAPGVPDIYQGAELWDLSLVDPDNRRPVDFSYRARTLGLSEAASPQELLRSWHCGIPKLHMISRALSLRRQHPELFSEGSYQPLTVKGPLARHVIAFARVHLRTAAIVVAPRLAHGLLAGSNTPHIPPEKWIDTFVSLHGMPIEAKWRDVLVEDVNACAFQNAHIQLSSALARFPVAMLVAELMD